MYRLALNLPITRITAALMAVVGLGLATVPLLGVHGPESALVLGAVLPPLAAAIGARLTIAARNQPRQPSVTSLLGAALGAAWTCLAIPCLLLALNALRIKNCDPWGGLAFMALGPWLGTGLAAVVGVSVAGWVSRPGWATAIAVAVPLAEIGRALRDFYASPAIFAYGHFFGYFPGTLYDTQLELPLAWVGFRGISVAAGMALWAGLAAYDPQGASRPRWALVGIAATLGLGVLAADRNATRFGHRASVASIGEALGGRLTDERCVLIYPRELDRDAAQRLHEDCRFRVAQMERLLGVRQPRPVTAFLFRSSAEKRSLMGAGAINIAKPWRNEVYLQTQAWPHPVFAHEIAHVVAGNFGVGPFRVAGRVGGLWPNPSWIEGLAVAAAWSVHDDMTPHQWARAMLEQDLAPPLASLTGASFLAQPKGQAYTLSGSFLRYVLDTYGAAAARRLYTRSDPITALNKPLEQLEQEWHAFLREVPLPAEALALAKLRFQRPGLFSAICPHELSVLERNLGAQLAAADYEAATQTCDHMLDIDPTNARIRTQLVRILANDGSTAEARRQLAELTQPPGAAAPLIASARESLADATWRAGDTPGARRMFESLLQEPMSADRRRQLEVKHAALSDGEPTAGLIFELLVGERGKPADPVTAMHLIHGLRAVRDDGLASYLEARQLFFRNQYPRAAALMSDARALGLSTQALEREALRLEAISRYAAGALTVSDALWYELGHGPLATPGTQAIAEDWRSRIRHDRRAVSAPRPRPPPAP